jgi:hypothetical protein
MSVRAKLILSFLGLAVMPLATMTLYSYISSLRALRSVAEQELSALASDMGSRMESVSRDINRQIERIAGPEFRQVMAMDDKDKKAAMDRQNNCNQPVGRSDCWPEADFRKRPISNSLIAINEGFFDRVLNLGLALFCNCLALSPARIIKRYFDPMLSGILCICSSTGNML